VLHEALATNKLLASTFQNVSIRWLLANGDHLAIRIMLWMVALNLNFFDILEDSVLDRKLFNIHTNLPFMLQFFFDPTPESLQGYSRQRHIGRCRRFGIPIKKHPEKVLSILSANFYNDMLLSFYLYLSK
jgi:hypothetical protein